LEFPASVILSVNNTIFGLKIMEKKTHLIRRFRLVEVVVMGYPLDAHRIPEQFPVSGIQNVLLIICQIYKIN